MRVIVAGSRSVSDFTLVSWVIEQSGFPISELVSGGARGVDRLGERYALERGIPVRVFPARWARYGRQAGFFRNSAMALYADALVLVWQGSSRGSALMLRIAQDHGLRYFVHFLA